MISTYDISFVIYETTSDEVWARLRQAQHIFTAPEGVLVLQGDNGTTSQIRVGYRSDNIGEVITSGKGSLTISLQSWENTDTALHPQPVASLVIGAQEVFLDHVRDYSEAASTEYPNAHQTTRLRTNVAISFKARARQGDPTLTLTQRIAALTEEARGFDVLRSNSANFTFGGHSQIVRINSIAPTIDPEGRFLELAMQLSYSVFPGEGKATADYKANYTDDFADGKAVRNYTVSGTIDAQDNVAAQALLQEIRQRHSQPGRSPQTHQVTDRFAGQPSQWCGLEFQIAWKIIPEETAYTISISTNRDLESGTGRTVYSGTVTGGSEAAALAKAQELGMGRLPVLLRSTETINRATGVTDEITTVISGDPYPGSTLTASLETDLALVELPVSVQFSYEYRAPSDGTITGSVRIEYVTSPFGEHSTTISGTITADTFAVARTIARNMTVSGIAIRERRETPRYSVREGTQYFEALDFSYLITQAHTGPVTMSYTKSSSPDFSTFIEKITYTGQIFSASEAAAEAAMDQLAPALGLRPVQREIAHAKLKTSGYAEHHITTSFTLGFERPFTGDTGYDLLEGTYTLERIGQVMRTATEEIAASAPFAYNTGTYNVGQLTINGSCKARTAEGARIWAQDKRRLAARYSIGTANYNGHEDPPRESMTPVFSKLNLEVPVTYHFTFTYAFRYARKNNFAGIEPTPVLQGLWPEEFNLALGFTPPEEE